MIGDSSDNIPIQSYHNSVVSPFETVLNSKKSYIKIEGENVSVTSKKKEAADIEQITVHVQQILLQNPDLSFHELEVLNRFYTKETSKGNKISKFFHKKKDEGQENDIEKTKNTLKESLDARKDFINSYLNSTNEKERRPFLESLSFDILINNKKAIKKIREHEGKGIPSKQSSTHTPIPYPKANRPPPPDSDDDSIKENDA
jgi:hypothetical protein